MSIQQVLKICHTLSEEGKKPTTALVKTRLQSNVGLAIVMKGIQLYTNDPNIKVEESPAQKPPPKACCCTEQLQDLQSRIDALQTQIKALQAAEKPAKSE